MFKFSGVESLILSEALIHAKISTKLQVSKAIPQINMIDSSNSNDSG